MKYLLITLLLAGCSPKNTHDYMEKYVDVSKLSECSYNVVRSRELGLIEYATFNADNGDTLFVAIKGGAMCLKRHKIRKGLQKRPS